MGEPGVRAHPARVRSVGRIKWTWEARTKIAEAAVIHRRDAECVVAVVRLLVSVVAQKSFEAPSMRQVRVTEMAQVPLAHHVRHIPSLAKDLGHELIPQSKAVLRIDQKLWWSIGYMVNVGVRHASESPEEILTLPTPSHPIPTLCG